MSKNIKFCACKYENIFKQHITPQINNNLTAVNREYFVCFLVITMHVLGSCEASAQYLPINFFVNLFHSKNSNLPHCFSDLIHIEYRKLHKNNGQSPFVLPSIMRSSVGQCHNIRFRQLSASHVIITSGKRLREKENTNGSHVINICLYIKNQRHEFIIKTLNSKFLM